MASGTGSQDPPRLPPPDYTSESVEDFAKRKQPPLRGIMVDPEYPPTAEEASKAFKQTFDKPISDLKRTSGASKIFNKAPTTNEVINTIPGGDRLTAGGGKYKDEQDPVEPKEVPPATLSNALKLISPSDYTKFHQLPCVRPSLLYGMIAGFTLGGLTLITGRTLWKATTYAVWSFTGTSVVYYPMCKREIRREKEGMRAAVKIMEEKGEEKKRKMEERKARIEAAKKDKEEEEERMKRENARWYKFW